MARTYHGECNFCLRYTFLRPVLFFPGMWFIVSADLCLSCRVGWRDEPYGTLVSTFVHSPRRSDRDDVLTAPREDCW